MSATSTLAGLGLTLPTVPTPVASYIPATRVGDLVFTSGQLPSVEGTLLATGKVGAEVTIETAASCARQAALNALAAVDSVAGLDNVAAIVKVTVFVASAPDFTAQAWVANGASELLGAVFGESGQHARAAVGVAVLPLDAPVEVELVVSVR